MTQQKVTLRFRDGLLLASVMDDPLERAVNHLKTLLRVKKGRISYVELDEATQQWFIDFSPVQGPRFDGFETYQKAVDAELDYLAKNPEILQRINRKLENAAGAENSTRLHHDQERSGDLPELSG